MTPIEPPEGMQRIALIDSDLYAYRVGYVSEDKTEEQAKQMLTRMLAEVLAEPWCSDFELRLTGKTNFRNDVAVSVPYKGGRTSEKPKHFLALRQHMVDMGATVSVDEEADDVVVYQYIADPEKYVMVHVDKDLDQAAGFHYNPVKKEFYEVSEAEGLRSFYTQLLVGDRVDNIQCIKGVGPAKALKTISGSTEAEALFESVHGAYIAAGLTLDRLIENARLLWLRRTKDEPLWLPPEKL
jgi:DNA polymerase I